MSGPRYLPNCAVIWRGPSLIDGRPIAVVVVGKLVYVVGDVGSSAPPVNRAKSLSTDSAFRVWDDLRKGRIETREPFPLPHYDLCAGLRSSVPSAVWAALDG